MIEIPRPNATRTFTDAAEAFRVRVDSRDREKFSAGIVIATGLDMVVDEQGQLNSELVYDAFLDGDGLPRAKEGEAEFAREVQASLSDEEKDRWRNAAAQLGPRAVESMSAETISRYIVSIRRASPLLADVMQLETGIGRHDNAQRDSFNQWMYPMMRYTYMLDTVRDAKEDYEAGRLKVEPTKLAVARLRGALAVDAACFVANTPLSVIKPLMSRVVKRSQEKQAASAN